MIEGMLPNAIQNDDNHEDSKTDFQVPEEITQCFEHLRTVISTIHIPDGLFSNTQNSPKKQPQTIFPPKGQTLFLCPVENCDFYTTKEGFKDNSAANHLRNDHKVTAADMTPGKYKFKKVKGEKCKKQ